jgi:hypothetical protein
MRREDPSFSLADSLSQTSAGNGLCLNLARHRLNPLVTQRQSAASASINAHHAWQELVGHRQDDRQLAS